METLSVVDTKEAAAPVLTVQERRDEYIMHCLWGISAPFVEELERKRQSTDQ